MVWVDENGLQQRLAGMCALRVSPVSTNKTRRILISKRRVRSAPNAPFAFPPFSHLRHIQHILTDNDSAKSINLIQRKGKLNNGVAYDRDLTPLLLFTP